MNSNSHNKLPLLGPGGLLLALCLSLQACGAKAYQNPELKAYAERFVQATGMDISSIGLIFGTLPDNNAGRCYFDSLTVVIDRRFWDWAAFDQDARNTLIFHELTHCVLGIHGHSPNKGSYMYFMLYDHGLEELRTQVRSYLH